MREASASSTIFRLILAFTVLFAGFLSVAIVYNRAYRLKNGSLAIIEKYEGINKTSLKIINNYLQSSGYTTKGKCESEEFGVKNLDIEEYEKVDTNKEYYYCLSYTTNNNQIFYKIKLFFKFNLPIIGDLTTFKIVGDTKSIKYYSCKQELREEGVNYECNNIK